MSAGILISLDHPRQEDGGGKEGGYENTGEDRNQRGRQATITVPDLNMQHHIKHPLVGARADLL